jgi:alpha-beta hydrolase superfamily lysophospholipase
VQFANGDVRLSGEIVVANDGAVQRPGIVFLHGSQAEGRWASRYLAHRFAQRGFAALIFDKRGGGESGGDWQTASFDDLAGDGAAAFATLAAQGDVDASRIGVFGHSQGGAIVALLAQLVPAAFVIGSAASGVSPADTEIFSLDNAVGAPVLSGAEKEEAEAFVRELVAVGYGDKPRDELDRMSARLADRPWFFEPPPAADYYWGFARRIAAFDAAVEWARVNAPVLLLYGTADERVPPRQSAEILANALRAAGNANVTVRSYENADHTFRLPSGGWPRSAPGYVDDMLGWATSIV